MDRSSINLYVWMPTEDGNISSSDITYVSLLDDCIHVPQNVHDITFSDFTLEACRGNGIYGNNVHHVQIQNLEIRNTGLAGARLNGDTRDVTISQCMIHDVGGGIKLAGGKRGLLESSGAVIENNEIYDFSRLGAVNYHAISVYSVGHLVRHNTIYNGQYTGIWFMGNDIVMEYNHVHHTCMNASDCGALHTGRDWTTNEVHVNIGGGRDNIVSNNVFYGSTRYSMQVDGRGVGHDHDGDLKHNLHARIHFDVMV
ncbi:uncharacterized protein LOC127863459 isoform X2 [Dreissena polymorpha]|uniref:uncharacterized protein LOC127863459 isoform X2 n=1 Tax=Dreissena polymorpha TaxID=45954 RepID=UPI0022642D23|nr:uncharacterized protein LOC127863459 isoform X2 [Dreissena polymorpha]